MNRNKNIIAALSGLLISFFSLSGCEGFFGTKTDSDFIDVPVYDERQVAYVPIQPVWDQFVDPVDVIAGYDELIYVADAGTEEIVSLDQAGNEIGRFFVPGISAIQQDRSLDILALGLTDTLIENTQVQLSTLFRIELKNAIYGLNTARVERKVIHPFYFKVTFDAGKDPFPRFNDIGLRADNSYYLTRSGPSSNPNQFGGPDDAVLVFNSEDEYVTPVEINTELGVFSNYFRDPYSITTLSQPPQSAFVNSRGDFVYTSFDQNAILQVVYITLTETDGGSTFTVEELSIGDTSKAEGFLYQPYRFTSPVGLTYSGDGTNYIFVVDSEKDSLYQFTNTGLEGVQPPAGSSSDKNIKVSFGGTGIGLTQFSNPTAVAYLQNILYVADRGNNRLLRFKLTTDFD